MKSGYRGQLKSGRPTTREATNKKISEALSFTEEEKVRIIDKLEEAAKWDYTIEEMCFQAQISHDTYNRQKKEKPEIGVRIEMLRNSPVMKAKETLARKVGNSFANSIEYLKRKRKAEFSERLEQTGADGKPLIISFDPIYNAKITPKTTGNS